jgi:nitrogen regulatory protein PII
MKTVKRVEIVVDEVKSDEILEALQKVGIDSFTLIRGAEGQGSRGSRSGGDITGVFANAVIIIACEEKDIDKLVGVVRPVLCQYGGLCLISDAQSVMH